MPQHEIIGRDLTSGQPTRLRWREDRIIALELVADAPKDTWIGPALIDLQINGFASVDFQQDNLTAKELLHAVKKLRAAGCARFLLTLIPTDGQRCLRGFGSSGNSARSMINFAEPLRAGTLKVRSFLPSRDFAARMIPR